MTEQGTDWTVKPCVEIDEDRILTNGSICAEAERQKEKIAKQANRYVQELIAAVQANCGKTGNCTWLYFSETKSCPCKQFREAVNHAAYTAGNALADSLTELEDDLAGAPHVDRETAEAQESALGQMMTAISAGLWGSINKAVASLTTETSVSVYKLAREHAQAPTLKPGVFHTPSAEWQSQFAGARSICSLDLQEAMTQYRFAIQGLATMVVQGIVKADSPAKPTPEEAVAAHAKRLTKALHQWWADLDAAVLQTAQAGMATECLLSLEQIFPQ
jgi:hypothetical protein